MIIPTLFTRSLHSRSKTPTQMNPDSLLTLSLHVGSSTLLEKNASLSDFIPHSWTKCPEFCLTTLSCFPTSHSPVTLSPFSPPQSCSTSSPLSWWLYLLCPPLHLPTWAPVPCIHLLPSCDRNCIAHSPTPTRFLRTSLHNSSWSPHLISFLQSATSFIFA